MVHITQLFDFVSIQMRVEWLLPEKYNLRPHDDVKVKSKR